MEINGIKYERISQEPKKQMGRSLSKEIEIIDPYASRPAKQKQLPVNDIEKEFELIQLKQSKLSRSERDMVVVAFNRMYKEIKNK